MIFNEAQTRRLLATFKYMDHSLENALSATTGEANDRHVPSVRQVALKERFATSPHTATVSSQTFNECAR
jgi:hypothetical protein